MKAPNHPVYRLDKWGWLCLVVLQVAGLAGVMQESVMSRVVGFIFFQLATVIFTLACHGRHVQMQNEKEYE